MQKRKRDDVSEDSDADSDSDIELETPKVSLAPINVDGFLRKGR